MVQSNDPFWHYVEEMKCMYCGHQFAKDTSISRIKWHLSGEKGRGVAICREVPKQVQEAALLAMYGLNKRHKSIASSSNFNDNAVSTTPQEQNNNEVDNLAGDAGTTQAADTMGQALERHLEEFDRWLMEDDVENETGGVVQPGAGASSSGGLTGNTNAIETTNLEQSGEQIKIIAGWTLLMTNLILEFASAVFDQLGYALIGMVLAFVALLLATAELVHMARKERMDQLPISDRPSTSPSAPGKPVGTIVEYFGLVGAVWQCFYSTVEYAYARQNKDNPIKMCLLPSLFLLCVINQK